MSRLPTTVVCIALTLLAAPSTADTGVGRASTLDIRYRVLEQITGHDSGAHWPSGV